MNSPFDFTPWLDCARIESRVSQIEQAIAGATGENLSALKNLCQWADLHWVHQCYQSAKQASDPVLRTADLAWADNVLAEVKSKALAEFSERIRQAKRAAKCAACGKDFHWYARLPKGITDRALMGTPTSCMTCTRRRAERAAYERRLDQYLEMPMARYYDAQRGAPPRPDHYAAVQAWNGEGGGIVLVGDSYGGKTTAAHHLVKRLFVDEFLYAVRIVNSIDLNSIPGRIFDHTLDDFMDELREAGLLLIDDLDKCSFSPRVASEVWGLIEHRLHGAEEPAPVIVTMNVATKKAFIALFSRSKQEEDAKQIGLSIYNRLAQACTFINFDK